MLTDAAKQHSSEERMEAFFSSGADAAYEIARGKKVKGGRYAFPVTLFPFHSGTTQIGPATEIGDSGGSDWQRRVGNR